MGILNPPEYGQDVMRPVLSMLQAEEFEFAEDDTVDPDCADGSETEPPCS